MENFLKSIIWAHSCLEARGYRIKTLPEDIQSTPWSCVKRFLTSDGYIYLKITTTALSLEPFISEILYNQFHGNVPNIIDINKDLNSFLMKDSGSPLHNILQNNFQSDLLVQAIKNYITIQSKTVEHIKVFLDLGVPDWRLKKLPKLYKKLISKRDLFERDGISGNEFDLLDELYSEFCNLCVDLSNYQIPETIDHCDFHSKNILFEKNSNRLTIIDWGETVITNPLFSLVTCINQAKLCYGLDERSQSYINLQEAALENWLNFDSKHNLIEAMFIVKKLWPVYAALGFYRLMESSNEDKFRLYYANKKGRLAGYLKEFIKINQSNL